MPKYRKIALGILISITQACGGGGGGNSTNATANDSSNSNSNNTNNNNTSVPDNSSNTQIAYTQVNGTAATGQAIASAPVELKCQTENYTTTTDASGRFTVKILSSQIPCLIEVTKTENAAKYHSLVYETGTSATANVSSLTELIITQIAGKNPSEVFSSSARPDPKVYNASEVTSATALVNASLSNIIATGIGAPITAAFSIGDAHDKKLDTLQSTLTDYGFSFQAFRQFFIEPPIAGYTKADYIGRILSTAKQEQIDVNSIDMLMQDSFEWNSGRDTNNALYYGFTRRSKDSTGKIVLTEWNWNSTNGWHQTQDTQRYNNPNAKFLDGNGNWASSKTTIISTPPENPLTRQIKHKTDNGVQLLGTMKITPLLAENVSGKKITDSFNPVYVGTTNKTFIDNSIAISSYRTLTIESMFQSQFPATNKLYNDLASLRGEYTTKPFCPALASVYQAYGIVFGSDNSAQLVPVDSNCLVLSGEKINLTWIESNVVGQPAIVLTAQLLPSPLTIMTGTNYGSLGSLGGTTGYKLFLRLEANRTVQAGVEVQPGNTIFYSAGNGPYLNKEGINSLINAVGYTPFEQ